MIKKIFIPILKDKSVKYQNTYLKTHKIFVHYCMYYKYNLVTWSSKLRTMKRQYQLNNITKLYYIKILKNTNT